MESWLWNTKDLAWKNKILYAIHPLESPFEPHGPEVALFNIGGLPGQS